MAIDQLAKMPLGIEVMDSIDQFVQRAAGYADRRGMALSTLSFQLFNDGKRLRLLRDKQVGITVRRLSEASEKLTELERAERAEAAS